MSRFKTIRVTLWSLNGILVVLVMVFAFNNVLFPSVSMGADRALPDPLGPPPRQARNDDPLSSYSVIWVVPNPMEKQAPPDSITQNPARSLSSVATLIAVDLNSAQPQKSSTVLKLQNGTYATAYVGKPVLGDDGVPVPLLQGYRLVEVYLDRAVFELDGRHREELKMDSFVSGGAVIESPRTSSNKTVNTPASNPSIDPGAAVNFTSQLSMDTPDRKVWQIDPRERDWVISQEQALHDNDITLSIYSSGGVRVDRIREGSIIRSRGFQEGDVIKSINGREVSGLNEAQAALKDPAIRNSNALLVVVNRAGRLVTLEYRLKSQ